MDKDKGPKALYEIQALLNAQDLKRAHHSFVDLCPEALHQQQQDLNRQRLRLSRHNPSKLPLGLEVNTNTASVYESLDNTKNETPTTASIHQTMFSRINKGKKTVIASLTHYHKQQKERYNQQQ